MKVKGVRIGVLKMTEGKRKLGGGREKMTKEKQGPEKVGRLLPCS